MANQLHVEVVAVEEKVWSGEAEMVVARTTEGEIGVLPGHSPLLGLLKEPSQVRVKLPGGEQLTYDVAGGFLSILLFYLLTLFFSGSITKKDLSQVLKIFG